VSDPKQGLDSTDRASPWLREHGDHSDPMPLGRIEPIRLARIRDLQDQPPALQDKPDGAIAGLRSVEGRDSRVQKESDIFAEAVARAMQEQLEPEAVEAPYLLQNRQSFGVAVKFVGAAGAAALVALVFVAAFPASRGPAEEDASSALPSWQSLKSSLSPVPKRKAAPTMVVRDGSGPVNEPLAVGVTVNSPDPGATITVDGLPATARLTVGRRISASEWRVPVQEISDASIIPPADFVGVMNLSAELRGSDGAALVSSVVRLTWTPASPVGTVGISASAATVPAGPAEPPPQQQAPIASPSPAPAVRAEPPVREISPDEVAGFVRRAQELLAGGDLQAARLLLLHAAEAHDPRAALALARTFDPVVSKQLGAADSELDPAQARHWYQKAEEWGAPEALASYTRR
jgi:hypothetical protein